MKEYPLTEPELDSLTGANDRAATRFAIGAFLAAFPAQWAWDRFVAKSIPEPLSDEAFALMILWIIVALGFFVAGIREKQKYGSQLQAIKDATKHISTDSGGV